MGRLRKKREAELEAALTRAVKVGREMERESVLLETIQRIFAEEIAEVLNALSGGFSAGLSFVKRAARTIWPERWRSRLSGPLLRVMQTAALQTDRGSVQLGFDVANPKNLRFFETYTLNLANLVSRTTEKKLEGIIREAIENGSDVSTAARCIEEVGEEFRGYRATLIARTELLNAARGASHLQAVQSGAVVGKVWQSAEDERVRDEHRALNGMEVGLNEEFPDEGQYPTKPQCRCVLRYTISAELLQVPE